MRLLLVEDTFDMAEAIMIRLDRSGIACDLAKSLEEARACVNVQHYDVIVLDINLPDGLGTELLKEIRSRGERTPVLMLTAEFSVDDRVSSLNSGRMITWSSRSTTANWKPASAHSIDENRATRPRN